MRRLLILVISLILLAATPSRDTMTAHNKNPLETRSFVVIGEGMAAGIGDFSLTEEMQRWSFPAQMAGQFGTPLSQPLIQAPGLGNVPGLASVPFIAPATQQTTVLSQFPMVGPPTNLSVPGFRVEDSLRRRFVPPLFQSRDAEQSLINIILNAPGVTSASTPPSQLELARQLKPTFVIVELGYYEAIEAAVRFDPSLLPTVAKFRNDYGNLVRALRATDAQLLLTTIPDPADTAYLSSLDVAGKLVKADVGLLRQLYDLKVDDSITIAGLIEIGYQLSSRDIHKPLPKGAVITAETAAEIARRVDALNFEIESFAQEQGTIVYDLHGFFRRIKQEGINAGERKLNGDFLGGFFLLNGFYPGRTGQALIANSMLESINEKWGASYAPIDLSQVLADDPTLFAEPAPGPNFTKESLKPLTLADIPPLPPLDGSDVVGFVPATSVRGCSPPAGVPGCGLPDPDQRVPLKLPPGLEENLTLNQETSYYGDALRVVDCPNDKPLPGFEKFPSFGTCGNLLFGGLAMGDVNLSGRIRIKFSEPENGVSHFEISHPGGLVGKDGTLEAPKLFRLPFRLSFLRDVPNLVSSGDLDLNTGIVTNLQYFTSIFNTALWSLISVNPNLPKRPLAFPGPAGSVTAKFGQRSDGLLDMTLDINGFLPLGTSLGGDTVRFPLPLCSPNFQCASIVSRGTSLHPHIHLSTKKDRPTPHGAGIKLPENTIQELTSFAHNNSFGDVFGLKIDELGGPATGRSHLLGRVQVQFGRRFGESVPVAISILPPGGLLTGAPRLLERMPAGIASGFIGFDENLEFPNRSYQMKELAFSSDPWNISLGAVDRRTGHVIGDLLHRGFVLQQLIFQLFEVEPCTPRTSFCYQGPAAFYSTSANDLSFRFNGQVLLPYPTGYKFPGSAGGHALIAGPDSRLEPFLRIQAMSVDNPPKLILKGADKLRSSTGQEFSYSYAIPCGPSEQKALFEYLNLAQRGKFQLTSLAWVSCSRSDFGEAMAEKPDVVTFTGFGTWSKDPGKQLHQVTAQISTAVTARFVGIQIDGGVTSNVNIRPQKIEDTNP